MLLTSACTVQSSTMIKHVVSLKFLWIFRNFTEFCQFSANFRVGNAILIDLRRPFKDRNQVQKELEYRTSNGKAKICFCGWYTHWNDTSYQNCFKDYQLENVIYMIGQIERLFLGQIEFTQRTTSSTFVRKNYEKITKKLLKKLLVASDLLCYEIELTVLPLLWPIPCSSWNKSLLLLFYPK